MIFPCKLVLLNIDSSRVFPLIFSLDVKKLGLAKLFNKLFSFIFLVNIIFILNLLLPL